MANTLYHVPVVVKVEGVLPVVGDNAAVCFATICDHCHTMKLYPVTRVFPDLFDVVE